MYSADNHQALFSAGLRSPETMLAKKKGSKVSDMNFEHEDTSEKKHDIEVHSKKSMADKSPFS